MRKKFFTRPELEDIELRKSTELVDLRRKIVDLQQQRAGLLLESATSESKAALAEITACEAEMKALDLRAESIGVLLNDLPRQKAYADSIEVEKKARLVDNTAARVPVMLDEIDKAAEALVLAVKDVRDELKNLRSQADLKTVGFGSIVSELYRVDLGAIQAVAFFAKKHNVEIDYGQGGYGPVSATTLNAGEGRGQGVLMKILAERSSRMKKAAAWLRGEEVDLVFCPKCYHSQETWDGQKGRRVCGNCSSELPPVLKPYEPGD